MSRPVRPSAVKAATVSASRILDGDARISIRVSAAALKAIKLAAVHRDTTIKRLVLEALRAQAIDIPRDADEDGA